MQVIKDHIAYRFEVLELMGEGTFGRVLKCRDHKTKQLVAMKVIANDLRYADEAMAEVEILELLQKNDEDGVANVVHMKEYFQFRDHLCITFDLMGKNLYEMMKERHFRGLGTSQVRNHAISLVQSLQLLSRSGIIHCDLKPENILLSHDNSEVIKVADFGASLLERRNTAPVAQTLIYMAPEVILTKVFSKAIDMWSLGCILAELKRGVVLFQVCDECELMLEMTKLLGVPPKHMLKDTPLENLLSGPRTSRRRARRHLSKALDTENKLFLDFIQSCLEYEPAKRMTPDEARQHPWVLMHFQSPSSSEDSSPHQSTNWEHMVDSTSAAAPPTSGPGARPVGARDRREDASTVFRKHLTPFERRGIKQYKEVWSLGIAEEKVIKDHIAYRYEVLELMGEGTFGRVLKCRDHKTQQLVAMKVIANDQRYLIMDQAQ
ncbi:dual specificity tyrosine-phosphorylation-regulated kinase 4-like [Gadus macrocephalus]|uniref:dual specificity tyrosine-phosphorylation-regulated kinase 4-like n=1 Tax=Gadus macrocephalus TaxID=80720 RepID=UPI0028CB93E4|nr:dual specificity tyrosine-phosphorylation-regulated kinase 4-like [Gadus macrocephalus]